MSLDSYHRKRNFRTTPEPKGRVRNRKAGALAFVVQKHAASHLHYDFRLELDGVLLSWAVPKGPSLDPADRRLAMHTEDHPVEYGDFEGVIPPKQYGSGTVMVWDRGTWEPQPREDPREGYRKGRLKFVLHGEKLRGGWTLVRARGTKYGDNDKSWLLIKEADAFARHGADAQVVDDEPLSVVSGRDMDRIAADADRVWHSTKSVAENVKEGAVARRPARKQPAGATLDVASVPAARKGALPDTLSPQLATLVEAAPEGDEWLHEIKFDGYRILARIARGEARLLSRTGKDWTAQFPAIAEALAQLPAATAWIDGEIVALDADGRSSFQALQNALSDAGQRPLVYYAFDVPYLDGLDLRKVPLVERKKLLRALVPATGTAIRYSDHVEGGGAAFHGEACRLRLEGIVSKRADAPYQGARNRDWLKVKCGLRQEFVIGGYTDAQGSRSGFGALHLGYHDDNGGLRYAGKVGTGFDERLLAALSKRLRALEQDAPPFVDPPKGAEARRSHWVKPRLVAEVSFTEWTRAGTLRHPSFQGLREDKRAADVVREQPAGPDAGEDPPAAPQATGRRSTGAGAATATAKRAARRVIARDEPPAAGPNTIGGVTFTHPERVMYPEAGYTKRDLAGYYLAVEERIVPFLEHRPLTLVRCPNGWGPRGTHCFYQKHRRAGVPAVVESIEVPEGDGTGTYMMANSIQAVLALVQLGVLELHPWGSSEGRLERPDMIVLDFDPDEGLPWKALVEAVEVARVLLDNLGLTGFLRTTGGKGLHIVVPIRATHAWDTIKRFTQAIAELLVRTFPDRFTATVSLARRTGKIFVDYLRNAQGATAIAPYSLRAKAHAPVATPIDWSELAKDVRFDHFNLKTVPQRLARQKRDPWARYFEVDQAITAAMLRRVGCAR
jgi:bifunctional non-homologous end joining protein LigD